MAEGEDEDVDVAEVVAEDVAEVGTEGEEEVVTEGEVVAATVVRSIRTKTRRCLFLCVCWIAVCRGVGVAVVRSLQQQNSSVSSVGNKKKKRIEKLSNCTVVSFFLYPSFTFTPSHSQFTPHSQITAFTFFIPSLNER